jgi:PHD/YefM family antitoxin component YafN of YafNO toxin-antitoxin module
MLALKEVEYLTDTRGHKKAVLLPVAAFDRIQEEIEDLEDALALEKARKNATGFKKWSDFVKEVHAAKK